MTVARRQNSSDLVRRIWSLCHILRGDGISYNEYISELTYLLFLKMAEETGVDSTIPNGCRWRDLVSCSDNDLLTFYRDMLTYLGGHAASRIVQEIYAFPTTVFSHAENLRAVIAGIDKLDWHSVAADGMGDIYEGLLAKNSQDVRSGAGQYFTPRALVDSLVRLMRPAHGEVIQDPSCGSGGFLISASRYIDKSRGKRRAGAGASFQGAEIEKSTYRICQMNMFLHNLNANIVLGDALTTDVQGLGAADLILANPPFGNKAGSHRKIRDTIKYRSGNKQLLFMQHIVAGLKEGGRAAVVVPDNVLFESGIGRSVRTELMTDCDLHTILRLPSGIFYSQGISTNVLFFTRRRGHLNNSAAVWVYDMRTGTRRYGKTRPLLTKDFSEFESLFGDSPNGRAERLENGDRWRCFTRAQIAERDHDLNFVWLGQRDTETESGDLTVQDLISTVSFNLQAAMGEIEALAEEFDFEGGEA